MEDKDLIKRLAKNDEKAFEDLFRKYFNALHRYANFYTGNSQISEDLVHDLFFKIWETRKTLAIRSSIKSYLYRSVHNNCIQYLRHLKVVKDHTKYQEARLEEAMLMNRLYFETGLDRLFEREINELAEEVISKLPARTCDIFRLSRDHFHKNSEIAKKFNVTEKAVEYHISKALSFLRRELKDYLATVIIIINCMNA